MTVKELEKEDYLLSEEEWALVEDIVPKDRVEVLRIYGGRCVLSLILNSSRVREDLCDLIPDSRTWCSFRDLKWRWIKEGIVRDVKERLEGIVVKREETGIGVH